MWMITLKVNGIEDLRFYVSVKNEAMRIINDWYQRNKEANLDISYRLCEPIKEKVS